jgi:2-polyprenyl-6-methoxyphenol hydroxylase-like FAD-dependent oxidoreductase
VGINLAVQDAVATARILAEPIRERGLTGRVLAKVQARRRFPTVGTQALQVVLQRVVLGTVLSANAPVTAPLPTKVLRRFPALQAIPARVVGVGLRPERRAKN